MPESCAVPVSATRSRIVALLWALLCTPLGALPMLGQPNAAHADDRSQETADAQEFSESARGRYLVVLADCAACHTDPARPKARFAGGRPIQTPFGNVLAPNITPDAETGIGRWTDAQFEAALLQGRNEHGEPLYPAMPYPYYTRMTRADVRAIRAFLTTVPPVRNRVVSNQLPFPYSIRAAMYAWNALYFRPGTFKPDPHHSTQWNRGAYLVEGPGHCGACHTPKTMLGGDKSSESLRGYSIQGWYAPDLTSSSVRGLNNWSLEDLVKYLRSGHNRLAAASGPMGEEVTDSSSGMTPADLLAIATYVKAQNGAPEHVQAIAAQDRRMLAGAAIYRDTCAGCHKLDGSGVPYLFPNLAASASVASREPTSILQVVLRGTRTVGTREEPTAPGMPAYGWQLNDDQVAAVATFVRNSWGHAAPAVSAKEVHRARAGFAGQAP